MKAEKAAIERQREKKSNKKRKLERERAEQNNIVTFHHSWFM